MRASTSISFFPDCAGGRKRERGEREKKTPNAKPRGMTTVRLRIIYLRCEKKIIHRDQHVMIELVTEVNYSVVHLFFTTMMYTFI